MKFQPIKGNTWALIGAAVIPVYRLDAHRCILLDSGALEEREALKAALDREALSPVGLLGSHAHIDHMGSHGFLRDTYGTAITMSQGEAQRMATPAGLLQQYPSLTPEDIPRFPELSSALCPPDQVILPGQTQAEVCGVPFDILSSPGHSPDHICIRTPDDVLYLGDSLVTPKVRQHSSLLYATSVEDYLRSLETLRQEEAAVYLAAHRGIIHDLPAAVDGEIRWIETQMRAFSRLADPETSPRQLTERLCQALSLRVASPRYFAYLETVSQAYLNYLRSQSWL